MDKSWNAMIDGVLIFPDWVSSQEADKTIDIYKKRKHYDLQKICKGSSYYFTIIPEEGSFRHEPCNIDSITD